MTTSATPTVARSTPARIRGRTGSTPSAAAATAVTGGIAARMRALFEALVRARPEMNAI